MTSRWTMPSWRKKRTGWLARWSPTRWLLVRWSLTRWSPNLYPKRGWWTEWRLKRCMRMTPLPPSCCWFLLARCHHHPWMNLGCTPKRSKPRAPGPLCGNSSSSLLPTPSVCAPRRGCSHQRTLIIAHLHHVGKIIQMVGQPLFQPMAISPSSRQRVHAARYSHAWQQGAPLPHNDGAVLTGTCRRSDAPCTRTAQSLQLSPQQPQRQRVLRASRGGAGAKPVRPSPAEKWT